MWKKGEVFEFYSIFESVYCNTSDAPGLNQTQVNTSWYAVNHPNNTQNIDSLEQHVCLSTPVHLCQAVCTCLPVPS